MDCSPAQWRPIHPPPPPIPCFQAVEELASELEDRRGAASDEAKYELLFQRDAEMTEFIDKFDETKEKEVRFFGGGL